MTTKPSSIVTPPEPSNETSSLARALIGVMDDRDYWESPASELLSLIGDTGDGIPQIHRGLVQSLGTADEHTNKPCPKLGRKRSTSRCEV